MRKIVTILSLVFMSSTVLATLGDSLPIPNELRSQICGVDLNKDFKVDILSGIRLNENLILTAGHSELFGGRLNSARCLGQNVSTRFRDEIRIPQYDYREVLSNFNNWPRYDFALLRLKFPASTPKTKLVLISDHEMAKKLVSQQRCFIAGTGGRDVEDRNRLTATALPGSLFMDLPDHLIISSGSQALATVGDSGGPVLCHLDDGKWGLIGIMEYAGQVQTHGEPAIHILGLLLLRPEIVAWIDGSL